MERRISPVLNCGSGETRNYSRTRESLMNGVRTKQVDSSAFFKVGCVRVNLFRTDLSSTTVRIFERSKTNELLPRLHRYCSNVCVFCDGRGTGEADQAVRSAACSRENSSGTE